MGLSISLESGCKWLCTRMRTSGLICFLVSIFALPSLGQTDAKVISASVSTSELVVFKIWVERVSFNRGDDIIVHYSVKNGGSRQIYLVQEPVPRVVIDDLWILDVLKPIYLPDKHQSFDYRFVRIPAKSEFKGKFSIAAKVYESNLAYEFEDAAIRVGFSYVLDVSPYKECEEPTLRLECLETLSETSYSLRVGYLVVDIVDKHR